MDLLEEAKPLRIPEVDELLFQLEGITPSNDEYHIHKIARAIEDITAFLISLPTQKDKIWELMQFGNAVSKLLAPLVENKFISINDFAAFSETLAYPTFFITSPEDAETVERIKEESRLKDNRLAIPLESRLIHLHSDVVKELKPFGTRVPYIVRNENPLKDIILGRGAIDMKGQIATTIVMLYMLYYLNEQPPFIILTSDEEQGSPGSKNILSVMNSRNLSFDLEPSSPELYTNEIFPYSYLSITLRKDSLIVRQTKNFDKQDLLTDELRKGIGFIIQQYYPSGKYEFVIDNIENRIVISIVDCGFNSIGPLNEAMCREILQLISRDIKVKDAAISHVLESQSELSPSNKVLLERVFQRRSVDPIPNLNRPMTYTRQINTDTKRGEVRHNFETALTAYLYSRDHDLIVVGPGEAGTRHTRREAGVVGDFVVLAKNLTEVLCNGREIFKEA